LDDTPTFPSDFLSKGGIPELLKAVRILKKEVGNEAIVVAGIIGPIYHRQVPWWTLFPS